MKMWLGPVLVYVISDPNSIEKVLGHPKALSKRSPYRYIAAAIGEGLLTAPNNELLFLLFPMGIELEAHTIFSKIRNILGYIWLLWIPASDVLFAVFMLEDWKFFQEYFTSFVVIQMAFLFVLVNTLVLDPKMCLDIHQLAMEFGLPWKSAGQELFDTLSHEVKMLKRAMVLFMFGVIAVYQLFLPYPDLCQPFHRMGQKYFYEWVKVIDITYYALVPCTMGYGSGCFFWKMAYLFRQSRIQCDILNRLLTNISDEVEDSTSNEDYQRRDYRTTGDLPHPRVLFILTMYGLGSYIIIDGGQQIIDKSEQIFHIAYGCPWYTWNEQNKQILLLIMNNSLKPLTFSPFGLLDVGHDMTCKMAKIAFSFLTILRIIQERNK